jgi:hypothetical protein
MCGAIPPLPHISSWRGAQLKHRDNFTLTFTSYVCLDLLNGLFSSNIPTKILYEFFISHSIVLFDKMNLAYNTASLNNVLI